MRRVFFLGMALLLGAAPAARGRRRQGAGSRPTAWGALTCKRFARGLRSQEGGVPAHRPPGSRAISPASTRSTQDTYDILPWQPPGAARRVHLQRLQAEPGRADARGRQRADPRAPDARAGSRRGRPGQDRRRRQAVALYRETVRDMQQRLVELGFLKGGVDGAFGPGTRRAVEAVPEGGRPAEPPASPTCAP